jgi:uncharacterized membrane protein (Fun14 family)
MGRVWKLHLIVVGLFCIAVTILPAFTSTLIDQEPFNSLLKVRASLMQNPLVVNAAVTYSKAVVTSNVNGTDENSYISTRVLLKTNQVNDEKLAHQLAEVIIHDYKQALTKDGIGVELIYGYDIGIASKWASHAYLFKPNEFSESK